MRPPASPSILLGTGGAFFPLGPDPRGIDIRDVAHSLSQQCRYAGHCRPFWSVAQHSLEVSRRVEARLSTDRLGYPPSHPAYITPERYGGCSKRVGALWGLLHDASEAYLQDIVRGIKPLVQGYSVWEGYVEGAVAERFGLPLPMPSLVKAVDEDIVYDEVYWLYPPGSEAWRRYGVTDRRAELPLLNVPMGEVEQEFLKRFAQLTEDR